MNGPEPRVAILTPDAADPTYAQSWPDFYARLARPLEEAGMVVSPSSWTAGAEPSGYDLVLPLMTWGYHFHPSLWERRLAEWEAGARIANAPAVLRWNTRKTYLAELAALGAPVVPTMTVEAADAGTLAEARRRFGSETLVVKPQVSGGAYNTLKVEPGDTSPRIRGPALIQPFLPTVGEEGELSLFYFAGLYSHAVVKVAKAGDFRVQPQFGGAVSAIEAADEARAAANAVLGAVPHDLLYARVDLIRGLDGTLQLMELELIEPHLFLDYAPDGGAAFARAVFAAARNS